MAKKIILASSSPRRYSLLTSIGFEVKVLIPDVDESPLNNEKPEAMVSRLAELKAITAEKMNFRSSNSDVNSDVDADMDAEDIPIIAADTIVCLDEVIFGKPKDRQDAKRMLQALSGREHEVITGFIVKSKNYEKAAIVKTKISFRKLSETEISNYVESDEPLDKSGSYAVQGQGGAFIDHIQGSFTNIMGLPMKEVLEALKF